MELTKLVFFTRSNAEMVFQVNLLSKCLFKTFVVPWADTWIRTTIKERSVYQRINHHKNRNVNPWMNVDKRIAEKYSNLYLRSRNSQR